MTGFFQKEFVHGTVPLKVDEWPSDESWNGQWKWLRQDFFRWRDQAKLQSPSEPRVIKRLYIGFLLDDLPGEKTIQV
jgi:hypothetical protein